jgi:hypothetical protein
MTKDEVDHCLAIIFGDVLGLTNLSGAKLFRIILIRLVRVFLIAGRDFSLFRFGFFLLRIFIRL